MTNPVRLTLSRNRGFDLQALSLATNGLLAVVVARPTKWGNPFVIGEPAGESGEIVADAKEAVRRFRELLDEEFDGTYIVHSLSSRFAFLSAFLIWSRIFVAATPLSLGR
jgi:hypothetical protein